MKKTAYASTLTIACLLLSPSLGAAESGSAPVLTVQDGPGGCAQIEGVYVAFVLPNRGTVLVSTRSFPGGDSAGALSGGTLSVNLAGVDPMGMTATATRSTEAGIWALFDRSLDPGSRAGCFGFGDRDFTTVDDLKTYLHWFQKEILFHLQAAGGRVPAVHLAGRRLALEVTPTGHAAIELVIREASTGGLRLHDTPGTFFFLPVVLSEAPPRALVRVFRKEVYFSAEAPVHLGLVEVGSENQSLIAGEPSFRLRVTSIEAADGVQPDGG